MLIYPNLTIHNEIDVKHTVQLAFPEEQFKQLLIIIIDNAIKYSGENKEVVITSGKMNVKIIESTFRIMESASAKKIFRISLTDFTE